MVLRRLALAALVAILALPALALDYKLGAIEIGHPWARPSVTGKAAVFIAFSNTSDSTDRLQNTIAAPDRLGRSGRAAGERDRPEQRRIRGHPAAHPWERDRPGASRPPAPARRGASQATGRR